MGGDYGLDQTTTTFLSWAWLTERASSSRNYWLATVRPDGRPHAMPVWGVWLEDRVLFSTGRSSRKGKNIVANPQVVIHLESGDEVVIIEGAAVELTDASLLEQYASAYEQKYAFRPDPHEPTHVTYYVQPSLIFAWLENDFANSATRWRF